MFANYVRLKRIQEWMKDGHLDAALRRRTTPVAV
jgi:hypothetical protein